MRVTILGSGGSGGVPLIGNHWGKCDPANPKNRRTRVSVLVEAAHRTLLIDTSPDCRAQLLDAGVKRVDAVLYTHDHADHVHGIDDLRFVRKSLEAPPIPTFGTAETLDAIAGRFTYAFRQFEHGSNHLYRPYLEARPVGYGESFTAAAFPVTAFRQDHGFGTETTGYRVGGMAYSTDTVELPEESFAFLQGLELWIVDCLRFEPHMTHATFDKALGWIDRVKPKHAVLTHLNQSVDYDTIAKRCPPGVEPAYDGLAFELPD
jgi:phosphoribosyl 1,2-cyclic phosphate phosphodiesterase